MTKWCKVKITKTITYVVEVNDRGVTESEWLDKGAHIAANYEDDFEQLVAEPIDNMNLKITKEQADIILAL